MAPDSQKRLLLLGRQVPQLPGDIFFDNWEVMVLQALQKQKSPDRRGKGKRPLLLGEAVALVSQLGGYLARGSAPPPGAECLWKGMTRLSGMAEGYRLADTRAASP